MLNLPLSFRVTAMHADENGHFITLREARAPLDLGPPTQFTPRALGAPPDLRQMASPETPPTDICLRVTADQFAGARVGGMYDVTPAGISQQAIKPEDLQSRLRDFAVGRL